MEFSDLEALKLCVEKYGPDKSLFSYLRSQGYLTQEYENLCSFEHTFVYEPTIALEEINKSIWEHLKEKLSETYTNAAARVVQFKNWKKGKKVDPTPIWPKVTPSQVDQYINDGNVIITIAQSAVNAYDGSTITSKISYQKYLHTLTQHFNIDKGFLPRVKAVIEGESLHLQHAQSLSSNIVDQAATKDIGSSVNGWPADLLKSKQAKIAELNHQILELMKRIVGEVDSVSSDTLYENRYAQKAALTTGKLVDVIEYLRSHWLQVLKSVRLM